MYENGFEQQRPQSHPANSYVVDLFVCWLVKFQIVKHGSAMQTVQYIQPQHAAQLSQAELVVIDEAAAIPLPVVKALLGPYLVFLCSTVNGYEGTGRSLSLKLIEQLRTEVSSRIGSVTQLQS